MKLLVWSPHRLVTQSLASALAARGHSVVAPPAPDLRRLAADLARTKVHLCVVEQPAAPQDADELRTLAAAHPDVAFVLLGEDQNGRADATTPAPFRAVVARQRPVADLLALLDHLAAGTSAPVRAAGTPTGTGGHSRATDPRWLAGFLTPRERQVLGLLVAGAQTGAMAKALGVSPSTVRCHVQTTLGKMAVHSRLELVTSAVSAGVVAPLTGQWLLTGPRAAVQHVARGR